MHVKYLEEFFYVNQHIFDRSELCYGIVIEV